MTSIDQLKKNHDRLAKYHLAVLSATLDFTQSVDAPMDEIDSAFYHHVKEVVEFNNKYYERTKKQLKELDSKTDVS